AAGEIDPAGPELEGRYDDEATICQSLGRLAMGQTIELSVSESRRLRVLIDESIDRLFAGQPASCDAEAVADIVAEIAFDAVDPFFWALILDGAIDSNRATVVDPGAVSPTLDWPSSTR
ncbi:MAG TPA: hypothetical protein VHT04_12890, partial [Stellaceae bacterium]|nr:hypothetical protein [Stellaceae bacterium]